MSRLLKDIYSKDFYNTLSDVLGQVIPSFNKDKFINLIFDKCWQTKELKERMTHTSFVLSSFFSDNFEQTVRQIEKIITLLRQNGIKETSVEFMFLPSTLKSMVSTTLTLLLKHLSLLLNLQVANLPLDRLSLSMVTK